LVGKDRQTVFVYMSPFSKVAEDFKKIKELSLSLCRNSKDRGFCNKISSLVNALFLRFHSRLHSHAFCRLRDIDWHIEVEKGWVPLVAGSR
jgi:hypothetical protein